MFIGPCACEKWNKQTGINQTMRPITHWRGHPVSELIGRGINQPISETMGAISQLTQCQNWSENRTRDRLIFCPHLEVRKQHPRCDNCPPWRVKTVPGNWPEWGDRGTIEPRWQDIRPPRWQDIGGLCGPNWLFPFFLCWLPCRGFLHFCESKNITYLGHDCQTSSRRINE